MANVFYVTKSFTGAVRNGVATRTLTMDKLGTFASQELAEQVAERQNANLTAKEQEAETVYAVKEVKVLETMEDFENQGVGSKPVTSRDIATFTKVAATMKQEDLLAFLAQHGITVPA